MKKNDNAEFVKIFERMTNALLKINSFL